MRLLRNITAVLIMCLLLLCLCACEQKYSFNDGLTAKTYDEEYKSVLSSWKLAVDEKFGADISTGEHKEYPNLPKKFEPMEWGMVAIDYSYYDIDRNGSPELIIAGCGENGKCHYIFDVYALNDNVPVRVFDAASSSGFNRFDGDTLSLSADGNKLICTNGKSKKCYTISKDVHTAQAFTEPCGEYTGSDLQKLYSKLSWKKLCEPAFSEMSASDYIDISDRKFKGVPEQYVGILNNFSRWIDLKTTCAEKLTEKAYYEFFNGKETVDFGLEEYPGKSDIITNVSEHERGDYGYGLYDLNGDKIKELLIMTRDADGNKQVWDIFSVFEGSAKRLLSFKERMSCYGIDKDGTIHSGSSDSSMISYYKYKIIDGGHIKEESIKATPINVYSNEQENNIGYNYSYKNNFGYDPDTYNDAQEVKFSSKEGKEIMTSLKCEPQEDDAPFIKFIPLFD